MAYAWAKFARAEILNFLGIFKVLVFFICKRSNVNKVTAYLHKRQHAEDDWELYEQVALLTEMESDKDCDGSESLESLAHINNVS